MLFWGGCVCEFRGMWEGRYVARGRGEKGREGKGRITSLICAVVAGVGVVVVEEEGAEKGALGED